mmetsp:Transcript_34186/g.39885  ORF Transcript_34186/g.39885 Transcript_34186/m.39885 type:complete len:177 (-) Transcript_34186:33-563(-)|eukprot:CAMPEP_0176450192 /NCGR_PEP_ID=MMETSP0127-20121128/26985_1 /TAXON_ID=938130 /ORGANISM="Platyophrya macrostoma, Strain WH" /LENGTH=176 /DNA_ID=CAMNT_0017837791 /DNA_START=37 /DNA_END=567 /DNA_ORIENTATION=+
MVASPFRSASGAKQKVRVSLATRVRAWWLGAENAEIFARYGERSSFRTFIADWKVTFMALGCVGVMLMNRANTRLADECMDNMELNRMRFYKRDFEPEYSAPGSSNVGRSLYDGAVGYQYIDKETGIAVNADNRIVAPPRDELHRRMQEAPPSITPEMINAARRLRDAHNYESTTS